jgi:hypothetical protein
MNCKNVLNVVNRENIANYIAILDKSIKPRKVLKIYSFDRRFSSIEKIFEENIEKVVFLRYNNLIYEILKLNQFVLIIRKTNIYMKNGSIQLDKYHYQVYII